MCDSCGCHQGGPEVATLERSLLAANEEVAASNRRLLRSHGAVCINLISSPGAGKTTLLEATIDRMRHVCSMGVIEGDIETERDADRIRAKGVPAVQITTGGACHLDAPLVHRGLHELFRQASGKIDLVFIENVGNLVCPAAFDLGEDIRAVLLSVPEGSDKPAKYPAAFVGSDLFVITKSDLMAYFDFSFEEAREAARGLKPDMDMITLSAKSGEGMDEWLAFLKGLLEKAR